ncbi:MarR family transcriptional regulator [Thermococcus guaymasensis DSM 11113]|uniref:HTH-type transcriptional regulator n=1 Tax=Thermococcus guaymasensis DSM 11113 TaxID=1432656 RepID=A0A0X1KHP4_9EURY|nr:MarR family transcriptional regulator [Thermococcus guaymasensis]AJC70774.1 MarR family transcriptional regulator [Thermococcus guaymasensis DSM 11113]
MSVREAKRIMMEHFARTSRKFGLSELYGYIYGLLFFEDEPMSLREIAERTGYSLSHVSSALKFLESIGLVTRIKKPGDRKAYYTSTKNIQEWRREAYYRKIEEDVKEMRESLLKALAELEGDESEEAMKLKKRIRAVLQKNIIAEKIVKILSEGDDELLETLIECLKNRSKKWAQKSSE